MNSPTQTVGGALRGIASSILFQLLQRIVTFIANVIIIRTVSEETTGFFHVHLQLLMNVVFFLSREFSRRTVLRNYTDNLSKGISFCLLTIPVGIIINFIALPLLLLKSPSIPYAVPSYLLHSLGLILELFHEPYLVYMLLTQKHSYRIRAELPAVVFRQVAQAILISFYPQYALIIYPFLYSISSLLIIIFYHLLIKLPTIDLNMLSLKSIQSHSDNLLLFGRQTIQKFLLQEGEKTVLLLTTTLSIQGIFSVISNISSLIVRFLFLPIEDVSYSLFSKLRKDKDQVYIAFLSLLKLLSHLALFILCFGPPYSRSALDFLYSNEDYTNNSYLLIIAFITIGVIAINGISETFFHSTATDQQLQSANNAMFFFSITYVLLCIVLTMAFKTIGLYLSNIISMSLRIAYSHYNIKKSYGSLPFNKILPTLSTTISLVVVFFINCGVSYYLHEHSFYALLLGGCIAVIELFTIFACDKPFLLMIKQVWNDKNQK
ncbi:Protein RFT1-like protein [Entamoeba marina]